MRGRTEAVLVVREFEFIPEEGGYVAVPCDMGGATEGQTLEEAVEMAADWLHLMALDALVHGKELPGGAFGHGPCEGGRVMAVAVKAELSDAPAVTSVEAAAMLGVSTARVAQMCSAGLLASWKAGRTRMVAVESVEERLAGARGAGRPRREAAAV